MCVGVWTCACMYMCACVCLYEEVAPHYSHTHHLLVSRSHLTPPSCLTAPLLPRPTPPPPFPSFPHPSSPRSFEPQINIDEGPDDSSVVTNADVLGQVASGLSSAGGVEALGKWMCFRTIKAGTEVYEKPMTASQACDARDALAKGIYSKLFDWLVSHINANISCNEGVVGHIGILDIFGFESFVVNSFEQLCINFANEKLQQKFTQDVFKTVQVEYEEEGIDWGHIAFVDNQEVLSLIEGQMGLLALLNEECVRPKGSDEGYASKVVTMHGDNANFEKPRLLRNAFTVIHYAGGVTYTTEGFLDKNRDTMPDDLLALVRSSPQPLLASIMKVKAPPAAAAGGKPARRGRKSRVGGGGDTVGSQFKVQLAELMRSIGETAVSYVRCIKPNANKSPDEIDSVMVVNQLRYAGVIEAIRISRAAFPNRMLHDECFQRFNFLLPTTAAAAVDTSALGAVDTSSAPGGLSGEKVRAMLGVLLQGYTHEASSTSVGGESKGSDGGDGGAAAEVVLEVFQIGKTRSYFRHGVQEHLEDLRTAQRNIRIVNIQRIVKGWICHKAYRHLRRASIMVESAARCWNARVRFVAIRTGLLGLQSIARGAQGRKIAHARRRYVSAVAIQSRARARAKQRAFKRLVEAAVRIQSCARMRHEKCAFKVALHEKKEEAKMSNQLAALQRRLDEEMAGRQKMEEDNRALEIKLQSGGGGGGGNAGQVAAAAASSPGGGGQGVGSPGRGSADDSARGRHASDDGILQDAGEMLRVLKEENARLRQDNERFKESTHRLKQELAMVKRAHDSAGASFSALNEGFKQIVKENQSQKVVLEKMNDQVRRAVLEEDRLKDERDTYKSLYSAELQVRVKMEAMVNELEVQLHRGSFSQDRVLRASNAAMHKSEDALKAIAGDVEVLFDPKSPGTPTGRPAGGRRAVPGADRSPQYLDASPTGDRRGGRGSPGGEGGGAGGGQKEGGRPHTMRLAKAASQRLLSRKASATDSMNKTASSLWKSAKSWF